MKIERTEIKSSAREYSDIFHISKGIKTMTNSKKSIMNQFQTFMEEKILPFATKIGGQRHMAAIRDGMTILIPLTIIGGFSMVLAIPPIPAGIGATNIFYSFLLMWKEWAAAYSSILMIPYNLTIGIISIYVVGGISYRLAVSYKMDGINNMISALLVFLCIVGVPLDGSIPTAQLGATSMFTGLIIAMLCVEITRFMIQKNITIKMPDSVPPNVSAPFNVLIPVAFNVILFIGLNVLCTSLTGEGLSRLVYSIFQPLISASGSLPSILLINVIMTTFWFFGIHGANMVSIVVSPITTLGLTLNAEAYATGQPLPAIFAGAVNSVFGNWITYCAILVVMFVFCKSSQLKSVAKVAVAPCLFNINEPMIFGIPTVLNIFTFIPLLICSVVNFTVAYLLMSAGILGRFFVTLPFTVPGPLQAFLATMDWKAPLVWFALLFVDILICIPFIKTYDKQLLLDEVSE